MTDNNFLEFVLEIFRKKRFFVQPWAKFRTVLIYFSAEDLPIFPVTSEDLKAVKARVVLAREIDKLELTLRRYLSEVGWKNKMAEEADMIVNESDSSNNV